MKLLCYLLALSSSIAIAEPRFKIAILDTGYSYELAQGTRLKLCDSGHYDFKLNKAIVGVGSPHGSRVGRILAEELKYVDYCAVIYQIETKPLVVSSYNIRRALLKAYAMNFTAINLSINGSYADQYENRTLSGVVANGTAVFVSAGNKETDLDKSCVTFPACYDVKGMFVVGALNYGTIDRASYSNYGTRINKWHSGQYLYGPLDSGTSFAVPRALSDYILSLSQQ